MDKLCILSWNINGLNACMQRWKTPTLDVFLDELEKRVQLMVVDSPTHIIMFCFQEIKMRLNELDRSMTVLEDWDLYYHIPDAGSAKVPFNRFSGVATLHRRRLAKDQFVGPAVEAILGASKSPNTSLKKLFDQEGRCVTLCLEKQGVAVVNIYGVANRDESRVDIKEESLEALDSLFERLWAADFKLIVLGDLNIAARGEDTCDPEGWLERERRLKALGQRSHAEWLKSVKMKYCLVDSFEHYNPEVKKPYTCWSQMSGARATNFGTRLDYILVEQSILEKYGRGAAIFPEIFGSDHCPVGFFLRGDFVKLESLKRENLLGECAANLPRARIQQRPLRDWMTPVKRACELATSAEEDDPKKAKASSPSVVSRVQQVRLTSFLSSTPNVIDVDATKEEAMTTTTTDRMRDAVAYLSLREQKAYFEYADAAPRCFGHR